VSSLESKLANDPNNLATLLNLGRDYMQWGYQVVYSGTTDADTTHGNDLLDKAISYFDQYLALNDSNSVKVDSALCLLYKGDTSGAISALQQITTDSPDYGPAWANLGLAYEISGDSTSALSAYEQAETTDADDEYGAKSYAERRIASINSSTTSTTSGTSATSGTSSTSTTQGLSDTLASKSNTGL
jgi:tetratricopeptide (TPR) repeat protein